MDADKAVTDAQNKLKQAIERFQDALKSLRTGRASASILDGVMVEAYGTPMPLIQVATVTVPEAQLIQITQQRVKASSMIAFLRHCIEVPMNDGFDGHAYRIAL